MSYRYDSDIPMVYGGWWVNQSEAERTGISPVMLPFDRQTILKEKLNAVFWFVSNCETQSKRELAVKKLSRFIPVDIFGKCSRNKADLNVCPEIGSDDCMRVLSQKYYFFIALENTVCKDYITEKYWNRYTFPSVPIVMRRKTYENHLPTNSFIAMDDFKSSKEMAAYLGFLMQNEERYMEYFGWRSKGWARPKWQSEGYRLGYCRLCEELMKEVPLASRSTREIFDWFINTSECEKDEFARNWE
ncbi:hypothetical protein AB6A40_008730 [Gnathostoma spinigerum]|uniref:Fucosyltransferase n=1 Tax=Gnathostoma spinigerum TaxID=75299 RepID=A0ABD6ERS3_9BILA